MSEDMSSSWRYLNSAASRLSSFKGYLSASRRGSSADLTPSGLPGPSQSRLRLEHTPSQEAPPTPTDERQSWRAWAGQKIKLRRGQNDPIPSAEVVSLFPGWAARRYRSSGLSSSDEPGTRFTGYVQRGTYYSMLQNHSKWTSSFRALRRAAVLQSWPVDPNAPS